MGKAILFATVLAAALPPLPKVAPLPALRSHGLTVAAQFAADRQPGNPAVGFGSVWVPSSANDIVDRYDAATGKLQTRIPAGTAHATAVNQYFDSVAVGATSVWAASDVGNEVVRIDPKKNTVVQRVAVPGRPGEVAVGPDGVYVSLFNQPTVLRIDPAGGKTTRRVNVGGSALGVAFGAGAVWALSSAGPSVLKLDPRTLAVRKHISVQMRGAFVGGFSEVWWISAGSSAVCIANQYQNGVTRIDPATAKVAAQVKLPFGKQPFAVAADGASCWAVNDSGVFRVGEGAWSRLPPLGPSTFAGVAAAGGKAWVTLAGRNALLSVHDG
ncbi:MAG TPA: glutaminyl-peptide cyclotransferase [Gaiellaceae bacterium]|nr:glutaminyl-peptide cyclotransferase [Gaiellaceae bacterium]